MSDQNAATTRQIISLWLPNYPVVPHYNFKGLNEPGESILE
ncbi:hypothetical protein FRUB_02938 [Fimbriiglobus ruber]|uniref:Uncharacterized protein n=1 Tax=Fimbriiglobus ruber TaxID=1908690 RepID=A0A225E1H5_9BACT|nr:hypothetical protein FRUB_02938 [Fimbriiglobus ruber]